MNPTPERTEKTPRTDAEADALARAASDELLQQVAYQNPKDVLRIGSEVIAARREISLRLKDRATQNEALRGALDELLAWSDTMRVAYEHPFLSDTAIHNARKTLSTPPAKA